MQGTRTHRVTSWLRTQPPQGHQGSGVPVCPCSVSLQAAPMVFRPIVPGAWCMGCHPHVSPGTVSWAPAVMVAPGQLCHGPGYLFDSTLSLCSVLPLCVSGLSRTIPTLGTALGRSTPSWGPSGMGTPLGQPPVPPSCLTMVAGGAVSCRVEAPGPRIRAAHLAPSCCPPTPHWAPAPGAAGARGLRRHRSWPAAGTLP